MSKEKSELLASMERLAPLQIRSLKDLEYEVDETVKKQEKDRLTREVLRELIKNGEFNWKDADDTDRAKFVDVVKAAVERLIPSGDSPETKTDKPESPREKRRREREKKRKEEKKDDKGAKDGVPDPVEPQKEKEVNEQPREFSDFLIYFTNLSPEAQKSLQQIIDFLTLVNKIQGEIATYQTTPALERFVQIKEKEMIKLVEEILPVLQNQDQVVGALLKALDPNIVLKITDKLDELLRLIATRKDLLPKSKSMDSLLKSVEGDTTAEEVLTSPWYNVMNNMFTGYYTQNVFDTVRTLFSKRIEDFKEKGEEKGEPLYDQLAKLFDTVRYAIDYGTFKKGSGIDLDRVAVNWENAKGVLGGGTSLENYREFRKLDLFPMIDHISKLALFEMRRSGGNWYSAGSDWNEGHKLFKHIISEVKGGVKEYNSTTEVIAGYLKINQTDPEYTLWKQIIDELRDFFTKIDSVYDHDEAESITEVIRITSQAETALRDYKSLVAIEKYGETLSAIKQAEGIVKYGDEQPQTRLVKTAYKIGKSKDTGKYLSGLAWIEMPDDLTQVQPETAQAAGKGRRGIGRYINYHFNNGNAAEAVLLRRWTPKSWSSGLPNIDEAIRMATTGTKKIKMKDETDPRHGLKVIDEGGKYDPNLIFSNYMTTFDSLNKLFDQSSTCWNESLEEQFESMTEVELVNEVVKRVSSTCSTGAAALSYVFGLPDIDYPNKAELFDAVRATIDQYIIYLLGQIKAKQGLKARIRIPGAGILLGTGDHGYDERYELVVRALDKYVGTYSSFFTPYVSDDRQQMERARASCEHQLAASIERLKEVKGLYASAKSKDRREELYEEIVSLEGIDKDKAADGKRKKGRIENLEIRLEKYPKRGQEEEQYKKIGGYLVSITDLIVDTIHDPAFKRKAHWDIDTDVRNYRLAELKSAGAKLTITSPVENINKPPQWPYRDKSDTSMQEKDKK
jgi:hypothetical protein